MDKKIKKIVDKFDFWYYYKDRGGEKIYETKKMVEGKNDFHISYYSYLNKAQQTQNGGLSLLEKFICDALLEGFQLLERK